MALSLFAIAGCRNSAIDEGTGTLQIDSESFNIDEEVPVAKSSVAPVGDTYLLVFVNSKGEVVKKITYADVQKEGWKLTLPADSYVLTVSSIDGDVPYCIFDTPVYGAQKEFIILPGKTTVLGDVTCKLLQAKVTVGYSDEFLQDVTGDGKCTVSVFSGYPLVYPLQYNGGSPTYSGSEGYFAVNGDDATMSVTYEGEIKGSPQVMTQTFVGIKPCTWHKITIVRKSSGAGNAGFEIAIDGIIDDQELDGGFNAAEKVIGDDPDAPKGDGGIRLESTCSYDITKPIVVPAATQPFVLTMNAIVPGSVARFTVDIESTNQDFINAVIMANKSTTMDLINPSEGAIDIFTNIIPFPYGDAVYGKTEVNFDLSKAQVPILAFAGTHTFVMHLRDQKGCRNDVSVVMQVN